MTELIAETLPELKAEKDEVISIIQSIEAQLAEKGKTDAESGLRLSDREYHEWRARAVSKRKHLLARLREIKAEIAKLGEEAHLNRKSESDARMERIEEKLDLILAHLEA